MAEYPVSQAMRELTPQQQEILRLNIVFGIPTKDIAKQMGCTTRNITKQRQKALEKNHFLVTGQLKPEDIKSYLYLNKKKVGCLLAPQNER